MVNTPEQMQIWNELMIEEHPQRAGPLVGRQLRYLIDSHHGWLGGFGFAAPALQVVQWKCELSGRRSINSGTASEFWKEIFSYKPSIYPILCFT